MTHTLGWLKSSSVCSHLILFGLGSGVADETGTCFFPGFLQLCSPVGLILLLLTASNFSPYLPVPWCLEVLSHKVFEATLCQSLEYFLLGSVTLHNITLPFIMNNEQVELIFFGNGQQQHQLSSTYSKWIIHVGKFMTA